MVPTEAQVLRYRETDQGWSNMRSAQVKVVKYQKTDQRGNNMGLLKPRYSGSF